MLSVLTKVFRKPKYFLLAITITCVSFVLAILFQNFSILFEILTNGSVPLTTRVNFFFQLLQGITTNFSVLSATSIILSSVLIGLNIALLVYYLRTRTAPLSKKAFGMSGGGMLAAFLGVGCAACGSLILTSFLPLATAGTIAAILPYHGEEFGVLAVALLTFSLVIITKQIARPPVCEVK